MRWPVFFSLPPSSLFLSVHIFHTLSPPRCCLVINAAKGIQTQTAECIVVAELLANQLVIVVNKIDLIPEIDHQGVTRQEALDKFTRKLKNTFAKTKFGRERVHIACVSAITGLGMESLVEDAIKKNLNLPQRDSTGPFMLMYDHAFPIKGQGTIVTGTVLSGIVKPGSIVDVPQLGEHGKGKKVGRGKGGSGKGNRGRIIARQRESDTSRVETPFLVEGSAELPFAQRANGEGCSSRFRRCFPGLRNLLHVKCSRAKGTGQRTISLKSTNSCRSRTLLVHDRVMEGKKLSSLEQWRQKRDCSFRVRREVCLCEQKFYEQK